MPDPTATIRRQEPRDSRPLLGIGLKVASVVVLVAMQSCIKAAGLLPAGQIVFFRSFFAVIPIVIMIAWRHELSTAWRTSQPVGHVMRGLVGVLAMGLIFFSLTRLPLPEAVTLNYAQPLLVVVFSAIFLHEKIRFYRWSAVLVGMVGVIITAWPNFTLLASDEPVGLDRSLGAIAALCGAAMSAIAMLLVRHLVKTESSSTIVLWFSLSAALLALLSWPFGWASLSTLQVFYLVGSGLFGGVGQILMTESYRHAEASTVAPFEYTSLILAIVVGFLLFGDVPTPYMLVGGTIVMLAGIFIIWREHRLGLERTASRKVAPPGS